MGYYSDEYRNTYTTVLKELDTALGSVDPAAVEALADAVLDADQVFFVGVGRCFCPFSPLQNVWRTWEFAPTMWEKSQNRPLQAMTC